MAEKVTITKSEYEDLKTTQAHMSELDARGVDNWVGYCGSQNDCGECGENFDWGPEKCPECGADVSNDYY